VSQGVMCEKKVGPWLVCGCTCMSHRALFPAPWMSPQCSPAWSRGQGDLWGLSAGLGEDLARVCWAYLWGSWKVLPAEVAVMVVVILSWRPGDDCSCPEVVGRGGE